MSVRTPRLFRPATLAEASRQASDFNAAVVAGGCERALAIRQKRSDVADLVLLDRIDGLDRLQAHPKIGLTIGAMTRMNAVAGNLWVAKRWAALHEAIEHMLPPQILNMGTVVGNICAAVRDYDIATTLIALRAKVAAVSPAGDNLSMPVADIYDATGRLALCRGAVVSHVTVGPPSPDAGSAFRKIRLPAEHGDAISTINVASYVTLDPGGETVVEATLAVGGCTRSPFRTDGAAQWLNGRTANTSNFETAGAMAADGLRNRTGGLPFDSVHRDLVRVLARDVIEQAASRARSKHNPFDDAQNLL